MVEKNLIGSLPCTHYHTHILMILALHFQEGNHLRKVGYLLPSTEFAFDARLGMEICASNMNTGNPPPGSYDWLWN